MKHEIRTAPDTYDLIVEKFDAVFATYPACDPGDVVTLREYDYVADRYTGRAVTRVLK